MGKLINKTKDLINDAKISGLKRALIKRIGRERRNYQENKRNEFVENINLTNSANQDYGYNSDLLTKLKTNGKYISDVPKRMPNINFEVGGGDGKNYYKNKTKTVHVDNGDMATIEHEYGHAKDITGTIPGKLAHFGRDKLKFVSRINKGDVNKLVGFYNNNDQDAATNYVNDIMNRSVGNVNTNGILGKLKFVANKVGNKLTRFGESRASKIALNNIKNHFGEKSREFDLSKKALDSAYDTYKNKHKAESALMKSNIIGIPSRKTFNPNTQNSILRRVDPRTRDRVHFYSYEDDKRAFEENLKKINDYKRGLIIK